MREQLNERMLDAYNVDVFTYEDVRACEELLGILPYSTYTDEQMQQALELLL